MSQQYMTLGYYSGFDKMFRPTFDVMDCDGNAVFANTAVIKKLVADKVLSNLNDREGLEALLKKEAVLHADGHLLDGVLLDRALREMLVIEIPLLEDEKRFALAWSTLNKIPLQRGKLTKEVKLPIGVFTSGTAITEVRKKLAPAFPNFDVLQALEVGINKMLILRREINFGCAQSGKAAEA
ncbi:hypothetical protein SAMN02745127_00828 [Oceanospirillum multiglobuliferum]|uniref:Uncharacterized protein n=1 Tax=Oceanospirillum multiglobuliferum TaxID=64969 RepID=A0A1T4ML61_9GAMM|nr:hypothetical protein [Oceanospirillum multiglobuliferum]OPX56979.1 hypothetical protein BTE48_00640 [Oceanospirillum multiglobuliferum]SJZ67683.1 hypothetical protein SAMN02745127_00828 [Oceanospirillum multiglobuliferum]